MRRLSSVAALMIVNAYCCVLLGLVLLALNPEVSWTVGFFSLMLFFCYATSPVCRLVRSLVLGRGRPAGRE